MHYNWQKIGDRIREERKHLGNASQEDLSVWVDEITNNKTTRRKIINWENGEPIKKMDDLAALCEIFDCDMSYLLCETDSRRCTTPAITAELGLSQNAVDILVGASRNRDTLLIDFLSDLIEDCKSTIENNPDGINYGRDVLSQMLLVSTYDLGHNQTLATTPDGYTAPIHSKDIYYGLLHNLHKSIDNFIDKERKKESKTMY